MTGDSNNNKPVSVYTKELCEKIRKRIADKLDSGENLFRTDFKPNVEFFDLKKKYLFFIIRSCFNICSNLLKLYYK